MITFLRKLAVKISTVITPVLASIKLPWSVKKITALDYRAVIALDLPPGTIFSTRTNGSSSNPFIEGFFKHVAILTEDETVVEATSKGVVETDLIDFLMSKDYFVVHLPLFADLNQMIKAAEFAKDQVGKEYDYAFATSDIKAFYCAEIIYAAYLEAVGETPFKLRPRLGQLTILPNDIDSATGKWQRIYASHSMAA